MAIISIIDDNTSILTSLSLQFQSKGYKTITFADPEKALLYHEDKPADAYVIDMKMPKLTGFEFYIDLCAVLNKDKLPALFLTAVDNLEERALKDTTIGDYVLKPNKIVNLISETATIEYQKTLHRSKSNSKIHLNQAIPSNSC